MSTLPARMTVSGTGATSRLARLPQMHRNAEARARLEREFGLRTHADVATAAPLTAGSSTAVAGGWLNDGEVFTVDVAGDTCFPGFQFDDVGQPIPVIADVLTALAGRIAGWDLALWFTSSSDWLGGVLRPVDVLDSDPELIVRAARALAAEILT